MKFFDDTQLADSAFQTPPPPTSRNRYGIPVLKKFDTLKVGDLVLCIEDMEDFGSTENVVDAGRMYKVSTVGNGWISVEGVAGMQLSQSFFKKSHLQVIK